MKTLSSILATGAILSVLSIGFLKQQTAQAQSGYATAGLKGTFGFVEQGSIGVNNPMSGVGLVTLNGNGTATGVEKVQYFGSTMQSIALAGTYSVNADGTGSLSLDYPSDGVNPQYTASYSFVLVNGVAEFTGIRSDNGTFVTATFTKQ
jgi:hypothetical protein